MRLKALANVFVKINVTVENQMYGVYWQKLMSLLVFEILL